MVFPVVMYRCESWTIKEAEQPRWPHWKLSLVAGATAKYWNFSFSISPSNEYSGLISFRID